MFKGLLVCIQTFVESDDEIRVMWNVGNILRWGRVMLGLLDVGDVGRWGCGMLGMQNVGNVGF